MSLGTTLKTICNISVALVVATSLSGCLRSTSGGGGGGGAGGGGGGGGGGPATFAEIQDTIAATQNTVPTTTQLTGTANYQGNLLLDTISINSGPDAGDIVGDLDIDVNFAQGVENPMSGTATNFRGVIDGEDVTIEGTLSTANTTNSNRINDIGVAEIDVPAPGSGTIYQTSMSLSMAGELSEATSGLEGEAYLTLQGQFVGDNGAAAWGVAGGGVNPLDNDALVQWGGQYYLQRQ